MTKIVARPAWRPPLKLAEEYRPRQRTATLNNLWKGMTRSAGRLVGQDRRRRATC